MGLSSRSPLTLPRAAIVSTVGLLVGCAAPAPVSDPVILSLGGQQVRRSEFEAHLRQAESEAGGVTDPALRQALLEPFLEERVLVLEARARGLLASGVGPDQESEAVRRLLAEVAAVPPATPAEVAAYFAAHAEEFRVPERVVLRQIVVPTEQEGREVRRRLQKDPKSFALLARSRSHAPEAGAGGMMGAFARGELPPELEAASFGLAVGALSEVVSTPLGVHVLRIEERRPGSAPTLEQSAREVAAVLARQKSEQSIHQFVRSLLARAKVNHEAAQSTPHRS